MGGVPATAGGGCVVLPMLTPLYHKFETVFQRCYCNAMRGILPIALVVTILAAGACCRCPAASTAASPPPAGDVSGALHGKATYYSSSYQGKKTASGEPFDQGKLTAAHRTLPFGTYVRVTSLASGKSVVVKINDRGPFGKKERIIDLSLAAARAIDMVEAGVVDVVLTIIK